jgi:hypothetical protein
MWIRVPSAITGGRRRRGWRRHGLGQARHTHLSLRRRVVCRARRRDGSLLFRDISDRHDGRLRPDFGSLLLRECSTRREQQTDGTPMELTHP